MNPLLIFILELVLVFLTSRYIFKSIFLFFLVLTKSQKAAISMLSLIFFVGVSIHELSHLLTAEVLRVKTHGIELVPELRGTNLKMGSVQVSQSDFLRSFLIGIAPLIVGSSIIISVLWFLSNTYNVNSIFMSPISFLISLLVVYLLFVISNTMFSSNKDMEGALELLILLIIFEVGALFIHFPINQFFITLFENQTFRQFMSQISLLFAVPVGINIFSAFLFFLFFKKKGLA